MIATQVKASATLYWLFDWEETIAQIERQLLPRQAHRLGPRVGPEKPGRVAHELVPWQVQAGDVEVDIRVGLDEGPERGGMGPIIQ